ncbi:hypothetical protein GCM10010402_68070 [Actinomadura luteofluorescens]|uniref:HD domain-containing protein n=1 Tax=Actinomadura luteofluorescens TaxID=46163 RepID=UPI0021642005|nr:caspase family protein [Actinomadura glauciflava]MCR3740072.1 Histidine kinase-, DNA gyrase B-, and HSP90-like ATPase [Actinomadura glauciflava]
MTAARRAHLIGVPRSEFSGLDDLSAAVHADVRQMEEVLRQSNYDITTWGLDDAGRGASRNLLIKIIKDACYNAPKGGILLLYFSGHGVSVDGLDYLVPSDAFRDSEHGQLDVDGLVPIMPADLSSCPARLVVYFVDACRENARPDDSSAFRGGLPAFPSEGQFILVNGCETGQVCNYNETGSTFTQALVQVLDRRHTARTLSEVLDEVTRIMDHQARWVSQNQQRPALGHPLMLANAGDIPICDGDKLAAVWRKSIDGSRLWNLCHQTLGVEAAQESAREIVEACAHRYGEAKEVLLDRAQLADPWADQDYPGRVLTLLETLLGDEVTLRPGEAALLVSAPFLREAVLAEGVRVAAGVRPGDLRRTYEKGPRSDLEGVHEMHQHIVRRAESFDQRGRKRERDLLATWLMHQWLGTRRSVWRTAAAREIYGQAATLLTDCRGTAGATEVALLAEAMVRAVGAEPVDDQLVTKLTSAYVDERWRGLAALLWLAGTLAADVRRSRPVIADLIGTHMELPLGDVRNASGREATWEAKDAGLDLCLTCDHPALHDVFDDIVGRANLLTARIADLGIDPEFAKLLPQGVTSRGLRPTLMSDDKPAYSVPLSRFQLSEDKIRELLMGHQLYDDPALAIRELYQNALDACRLREIRLKALQRNGDNPESWTSEIAFRQGKEGDRHYIECEDNGAGMNADILQKIFANAGERLSYRLEFRDEQAEWQERGLQMIPNSQFGIGVFSYFMLADEITVTTRHVPREGTVDPHGWEVHIANSGSLFQITPTTGMPGGGTKVRLYLTEQESSISVVQTMRQLLWISEHRVTVTEEDSGSAVWTSGTLRYHDEVAVSEQYGNDLWWVSGEGGLAADGIRTNEEIYGLIINLRGERRPQFTVDRKKLREWDKKWVTRQIQEALPALMEWAGFTLPWLWEVTKSKPEIAQQIFDHAIANDHFIQLGGIWGQNLRVPMVALGCLPSDRELFNSKRYNFTFSGWFASWRGSLWKTTVGATVNTRSAPIAMENRGFPQTGPLDAELIAGLGREFDDREADIDVLLQVIEHPEQEGINRIRRLRRYAITGMGLSELRNVPPVRATCKDADQGLYRALAAWSPPGQAPRRSAAGWIVKTSAVLDRSIGEILEKAGRLVPSGWHLPEMDLGSLANHTCTNTDAVLVSVDLDGAPPWIEHELGPAHIVAATIALGRTVEQVLAHCDRLAPLGVRVATRASYPTDLTKTEIEALGRVEHPGEILHMAALLTVAGRTGNSLFQTGQQLARLERLGLLTLPPIEGLDNLHVGVEELDFIEGALVTRPIRSGVPTYSNTPHVRIVNQLARRFFIEDKDSVAARRLAPYFTPKKPISGVEIFFLSYMTDRTIGEILEQIINVYPEAILPEIPEEILELIPQFPISRSLMGTFYHASEPKWVECATAAVPDAIAVGMKLGDYLTLLAPYRSLGAPVPDLSQSETDTLNSIDLDDYDADMLSYFDQDLNQTRFSPDRRYRSSLNALDLVRTAGRLGASPAEMDRRMRAFKPLGLTLDYPDVKPPDEVVLWQDLLLLTVHGDGYPPSVSGEIDPSHLTLVAAETGERVSWLIERLKVYAPLFSITIIPEGKECPTIR